MQKAIYAKQSITGTYVNPCSIIEALKFLSFIVQLKGPDLQRTVHRHLRRHSFVEAFVRRNPENRNKVNYILASCCYSQQYYTNVTHYTTYDYVLIALWLGLDDGEEGLDGFCNVHSDVSYTVLRESDQYRDELSSDCVNGDDLREG